eukprot:5465361-Prymnesium_polylepis.3
MLEHPPNWRNLDEGSLTGFTINYLALPFRARIIRFRFRVSGCARSRARRSAGRDARMRLSAVSVRCGDRCLLRGAEAPNDKTESPVVLERSQTRVLTDFVSKSRASSNFDACSGTAKVCFRVGLGGSHLEPGLRSAAVRRSTFCTNSVIIRCEFGKLLGFGALLLLTPAGWEFVPFPKHRPNHRLYRSLSPPIEAPSRRADQLLGRLLFRRAVWAPRRPSARCGASSAHLPSPLCRRLPPGAFD